MTEQQLLLQAIADDHESDSPRLVYADWLEERGDTMRAEFVRLGCELATRQKNWQPFQEVWEQYQTIRNRKERSWLRELKLLDIKKFEFNRGVLEKITINASRALPNVEEAFRKFPTIRSAKITELHSVGKSFVDQFLELPCMQQLRTLDLSFSRLGGIEAEKIGRAKFLGKVENLRLRGNPIHQRGIESILCGEGFPNLRRLDISKCNLGEEFDARKGFENPRFKRLELLAAADMYWPQSAFEILAQADMTNLSALQIGPIADNRHTEKQFRELLGASTFANLETLIINGHLPARLFRVLCSHPMAKNIKQFVYSFSGKGLESFAKSDAIWTNLKRLGMYTLINPKNFKLIMRTPKFSQLDTLRVAAISIDLSIANKQLQARHGFNISSIGVPSIDWPI